MTLATHNGATATVLQQAPAAPERRAKLKITYIEPEIEEYEVRFDRSKISWADFVQINLLAEQGKQAELIGLFSRMMKEATGLDVDQLPAYIVSELMDAVKNIGDEASLKN